MDQLRQDLRYALRVLRNGPGFTITAALVIMLGTATVTTIFSVVNTLFLTPSPGIGTPQSLVDVDRRRDEGRHPFNFSYPLYRDLAQRTRTLSGLAAFANAQAIVALPGAGDA